MYRDNHHTFCWLDQEVPRAAPTRTSAGSGTGRATLASSILPSPVAVEHSLDHLLQIAVQQAHPSGTIFKRG